MKVFFIIGFTVSIALITLGCYALNIGLPIGGFPLILGLLCLLIEFLVFKIIYKK